MQTSIQSPVRFTKSAIEELRRLVNGAGFDQSQKLRVGVKGGGCTGLSYILNYDHQKENDNEYSFDGFSFIIDKAHEMYLFGMEIDWQGGLNSRGFTFNNPNASETCGCGTSFAV